MLSVSALGLIAVRYYIVEQFDLQRNYTYYLPEKGIKLADESNQVLEE
jgi:hypothetical protein